MKKNHEEMEESIMNSLINNKKFIIDDETFIQNLRQTQAK